MSALADSVTVLRTKGLPATKTIGRGADGHPSIISGYGEAKRFSIRTVPVSGIRDLAQALDGARQDEFVIRGEPLPGVAWTAALRRLHPDPETGEQPTFREVPRRWVLIDIDHLPGPYCFDPLDGELAAEFARTRLPHECRRATCWWQLTSSAGIKPGIHLRLAFWLDRPVDKKFLDRWFGEAPTDRSVFRPVQAIYCARPILRGVPDPVRQRPGLLEDRDDLVRVPELPAEAPQPVRQTHSPDGRRYVSGSTQDVAERRLDALCRAIERAGVGGRHRCLIWAAARAVELDDALPRETIAQALIAAAQRAGVDDHEADLARQVRNGFKLGIFGTGAAA
jgi:hypothetical protein